MASYAAKNLGEGQLPSSKTTIYTVPLNSSAIVKLISFVNTSGSTTTFNLYVSIAGGTSRRIMPKDVSLEARQMIEHDTVLTLSSGDKIEADCANATTVDYVISGIEAV